MFDQPSSGLHQPLLQTRQRPVLDSLGQHQPPPQIPQIVGQQAQRQPHLVRAETMATQSRHLHRLLSLFDPLLSRAPQHGENRDILERLYVVRLDRLRALDKCRSLLVPLDRQGLLSGANAVAAALVVGDLPVNAQVREARTSMELGSVTVWLGMPKQEVVSRCASAGYSLNDTNELIFDTNDPKKATADSKWFGVKFKNGRLS